MLLRIVVSMFIVCLLAIGSGAVHAQTFPTKPIQMFTSEVGGGNDLVTRLLASALSSKLGQQVVVQNRAGSGNLFAEQVAQAPADGYTLLCHSSSWYIEALWRTNVGYDPVKEFTPISLVATAPSSLVVTPSLPVKSVKELIALAKSKPGQLNYASAQSGLSAHLLAEMFKKMAGVNLVRVAYKGNAPGLIGVINGEAQVMFPSAGSVKAHIDSGKVRALAVTSPKPTPLAPGLPTVAADLPGFEQLSIYGVFAPAKTSPAIVKKLNEDIAQVLQQPEVKDKFLKAGLEAESSSPAEMGKTMQEDMTRWGQVIKDLGGIRE